MGFYVVLCKGLSHNADPIFCFFVCIYILLCPGQYGIYLNFSLVGKVGCQVTNACQGGNANPDVPPCVLISSSDNANSFTYVSSSDEGNLYTSYRQMRQMAPK